MKIFRSILRAILSFIFTSFIFIALPYYLNKLIPSDHVTVEFLNNMNILFLMGMVVVLLSTARWFFERKFGLILSISYVVSLLVYLYYIFLNSSIFVKIENMYLMINYGGILLIFMFIAFSFGIFAYTKYLDEVARAN